MSGGLMSGGLKSYDHRLSVAVLLLPLFLSLDLVRGGRADASVLSGDLCLVLGELSEDITVSSRRSFLVSFY